MRGATISFFALRAFSLTVKRVAGERHAAHRRHAVREPQLVGVLGFGVLRRAAGVHVQVDEAGHHVHPGRVDFVLAPAGRGSRAAAARACRRCAPPRSGCPRRRCRPDRAAGAPVPSISIAPRITSVLNGPLPSSARRFGAARIDSSCAAAGRCAAAGGLLLRARRRHGEAHRRDGDDPARISEHRPPESPRR